MSVHGRKQKRRRPRQRIPGRVNSPWSRLGIKPVAMLLVPYASCYNHFVAIQEVEFSLKNDIWIASSPRTPIHVKQALLLIQLFPTFNFGKLT